MMREDGLNNRELISALVDGQLRGAEFARVVESVSESEDALAAWHAYHLIGDTLRCADLAVDQDELAFVARLRTRLECGVEAEPFALRAVHESPVASVAAAMPLSNHGDTRRSANDSVQRWRLLAGAASLAAVAAIGWQLAGSGAGASSSPQLAAAPGQAPTVVSTAAPSNATGTAEPQVMLRDARLDELLAAHKQFGGTSALQMPAGFLRNATFETPGR